jgi:ABC-type Na+ efflux pump permease subunit
MKTTLKISAILLTLFALITVFMSGSVIFDLFGIRAKEGNYVLFIVVSNFISGFLYLISAYGMFFQKKWATRLLVFITTILLLSFAGLLWHINGGGIYEQQTIKAMLFRIGITILFTGISWRFMTTDAKSKIQ